MATLERVLSGNPFEQHRVLRAIFPGDRAQHVEQDTLTDLAKGAADLYGNHIYMIRDESGEVVGITGFFKPGVGNGPVDTLALRWHGIAPVYRGRGLSERAFTAVCEEASRVHPLAERLIELVPLADPDNARTLIGYFEKLGFRKDGPARDASTFPDAVALPMESGNWQGMVFELRPRAPVRWLGKGII